MMIKCRLYQASGLNYLPKGNANVTRKQAHTLVAPSARSVPRPLFWTYCSVQTINEGGPKGLMDEERSSHERVGRLIGISEATDGRPYAELYSLKTRKVLRRETQPRC
jgi:hypothetical protein